MENDKSIYTTGVDSPASWLAYQQLLDSALPIGGFSHSFGLETMVQEMRINNTIQLRSYVENMVIHNWACGDALVIKAVYRDVPAQGWERLWAVERQIHMQRLAMESRKAAEKMGRRLLALAIEIFPSIEWQPLSGACKQGDALGTHALVHGFASYQLGIPMRKAVEGYLYTCIVNSMNSALRLMSMGQTEAQKLIAAIMPITEKAVWIVEQTEPEEAWNSMPMAELAMVRHETLYSRLFMS
ncbi:urease accessory protein UreF [Paenibacillus agri]|uniref:Urease accessory protein UreF n=1 Tax=Paenibacillus agri TaxID=2744309 RepID=A0A850EKV5_9BACL|nr:urease accessory UreF family protein [Paenibacillus agri]NUU60359.1 urease accessory protein UreF [Paenibacillus agri]